VSVSERLGDLNYLTTGLLGAEVDGSSDGCCTHFVSFFDGSEHDLIVTVGVGHQLIVVDLYNEGDLVSVFASYRAENSIGGGHSVTATLDGELYDVLGVKVHGVGSKRGARGVLDALVDGKNAKIAGVGQTPGSVKALEISKNGNGAVGGGPNSVDEIGTGSVDGRCGNGFAFVAQECIGVLTKEITVVRFCYSCSHFSSSFNISVNFTRYLICCYSTPIISRENFSGAKNPQSLPRRFLTSASRPRTGDHHTVRVGPDILHKNQVAPTTHRTDKI